MKLNPVFISNVHDIYGEVGDIWLEDLPHQINQLSTLWAFHLLNPMPNLSYNFVGLVKMKITSKTAVLKMAPKGGNLASEMQWLKCIEKGAPEIYALDENFNAYLMEHLNPGHPLKSLVKTGKDDEATRIICQTIRNFQSQHCNKANFRHLSELSRTLPLLKGHFDAKLLSKAQKLFSDLTTDRSHDVVLHGDLHHDNILASGSEWKAIDPHGYVGDPAAEGGPMVHNAFECFPNNPSIPKIVENRLKIMADELPYDAHRIKSWAFCLTALSGAWSLEDHGKVPRHIIEVASAIDQMTA